jgi:hypothetical protein
MLRGKKRCGWVVTKSIASLVLVRSCEAGRGVAELDCTMRRITTTLQFHTALILATHLFHHSNKLQTRLAGPMEHLVLSATVM